MSAQDNTKPDTSSASTPDAPQKMKMLPPTLVLQHVVIGLVLNWFIPVSYGWGFGIIGLFLLWFAYSIIGWSKKLFAEAGTEIAPNQPTTAIVTTGPYSISRNPIYLGFVIGLIGLSFVAGAPIMTLMALPLYYLLDSRVIAPEEEFMEDEFGQDYIDYKATTRRWI